MKKVKPILIWCQKKVRTFFTWYRNLYRGRKWYTKTLIGIASCIVAFFLYLGAVDINLLWLFGQRRLQCFFGHDSVGRWHN